jgi:hypothetical protein
MKRFSTDFWKILNVKFHENQSSGSRVFPCGRADRRTEERTERQADRQTDMTKLIVAFRNFANVPENWIGKNLKQDTRGLVECNSMDRVKEGRTILNKNIVFAASSHVAWVTPYKCRTSCWQERVRQVDKRIFLLFSFLNTDYMGTSWRA